LLAIAFTFSSVSFAAPSLPDAVTKKLKEIYPSATKFEWEEGLINSDERNDLAIVVYMQKGYEALAVFYAESSGGYKFEANSRTWMESDRIGWNLTIEKNSVFMHFECKALCGNSAANGHFQFKEYKGTLSLIGEEFSEYLNPTQNNDAIEHSINYLTGKSYFARTTGKQHKKFERRLKDLPPLNLNQFDMWQSKDPRPAI
jgi:hypothetical protein